MTILLDTFRESSSTNTGDSKTKLGLLRVINPHALTKSPPQTYAAVVRTLVREASTTPKSPTVLTLQCRDYVWAMLEAAANEDHHHLWDMRDEMVRLLKLEMDWLTNIPLPSVRTDAEEYELYLRRNVLLDAMRDLETISTRLMMVSSSSDSNEISKSLFQLHWKSCLAALARRGAKGLDSSEILSKLSSMSLNASLSPDRTSGNVEMTTRLEIRNVCLELGYSSSALDSRSGDSKEHGAMLQTTFGLLVSSQGNNNDSHAMLISLFRYAFKRARGNVDATIDDDRANPLSELLLSLLFGKAQAGGDIISTLIVELVADLAAEDDGALPLIDELGERWLRDPLPYRRERALAVLTRVVEIRRNRYGGLEGGDALINGALLNVFLEAIQSKCAEEEELPLFVGVLREMDAAVVIPRLFSILQTQGKSNDDVSASCMSALVSLLTCNHHHQIREDDRLLARFSAFIRCVLSPIRTPAAGISSELAERAVRAVVTKVDDGGTWCSKCRDEFRERVVPMLVDATVDSVKDTSVLVALLKSYLTNGKPDSELTSVVVRRCCERFRRGEEEEDERSAAFRTLGIFLILRMVLPPLAGEESVALPTPLARDVFHDACRVALEPRAHASSDPVSNSARSQTRRLAMEVIGAISPFYPPAWRFILALLTENEGLLRDDDDDDDDDRLEKRYGDLKTSGNAQRLLNPALYGACFAISELVKAGGLSPTSEGADAYPSSALESVVLSPGFTNRLVSSVAAKTSSPGKEVSDPWSGVVEFVTLSSIQCGFNGWVRSGRTALRRPFGTRLVIVDEEEEHDAGEDAEESSTRLLLRVLRSVGGDPGKQTLRRVVHEGAARALQGVGTMAGLLKIDSLPIVALLKIARSSSVPSLSSETFAMAAAGLANAIVGCKTELLQREEDEVPASAYQLLFLAVFVGRAASERLGETRSPPPHPFFLSTTTSLIELVDSVGKPPERGEEEKIVDPERQRMRERALVAKMKLIGAILAFPSPVLVALPSPSLERLLERLRDAAKMSGEVYAELRRVAGEVLKVAMNVSVVS